MSSIVVNLMQLKQRMELAALAKEIHAMIA
jgi:hypothetical protein